LAITLLCQPPTQFYKYELVQENQICNFEEIQQITAIITLFSEVPIQVRVSILIEDTAGALPTKIKNLQT
jgi:hypothetical protein